MILDTLFVAAIFAAVVCLLAVPWMLTPQSEEH